MQMPGRNGTVSGGEYRYAFNGMETDKEVSGGGNSYTTQFRQYDPRLGRWKSLDPLAGKFPNMSPFVGMDNNPIVLTDVLGLETGEGEPDKTVKSEGKKTKSSKQDEHNVLDNIDKPNDEYTVKFEYEENEAGFSHTNTYTYNEDSESWELESTFTVTRSDGEIVTANKGKQKDYKTPPKSARKLKQQSIIDDALAVTQGSLMLDAGLSKDYFNPYTTKGGGTSYLYHTANGEKPKAAYSSGSGEFKGKISKSTSGYDSFGKSKLLKSVGNLGVAGDIVQGGFVIKDLISNPYSRQFQKDAAWAVADIVSDRLITSGVPIVMAIGGAYKLGRLAYTLIYDPPPPSTKIIVGPGYIPPFHGDSDRLHKSNYLPPPKNPILGY